MNKEIGTELNIENLSLLIKKMIPVSLEYMEYVPIGCITNHFDCSSENVIDFVKSNKPEFQIIYTWYNICVSTPELNKLLEKHLKKKDEVQKTDESPDITINEFIAMLKKTDPSGNKKIKILTFPQKIKEKSYKNVSCIFNETDQVCLTFQK